MKNVLRLGVNIDHVATLRQARGTEYPDPVVAAMIAQYAGAHAIVAHLREDRRHIRERDIILIQQHVTIPFNLEMSVNKSVVDFAVMCAPAQATLVPEKRRELTTEGGLHLKRDYKKIERAVKRLQDKGVIVSLFIDPDMRSIELAKKIGATRIEFNTGRFSEAAPGGAQDKETSKISHAAAQARVMGFCVAAGHGINYENVRAILTVKDIEELNIGHAIISRSVYTGLVCAVDEMLMLMNEQAKGGKKK